MIEKIKDTKEYVFHTNSGVQKRGKKRVLTMNSKFPDGYFEWLDQCKKYDPTCTRTSIIDYLAICDIQKQADEAEKQTEILAKISKAINNIEKILATLEFEKGEEEENEQVGGTEIPEGLIDDSGFIGEDLEESEEY